MKFNDSESILFERVRSNEVLGITNIRLDFFQTNDRSYLVVNQNTRQDTLDIDLHNRFNLLVSLEEEGTDFNSSFTVNYHKGKNIFIDACASSKSDFFNIPYYKGTVVLD